MWSRKRIKYLWICESEHFPILENLLCLPCNDSYYGQIGCKGECDSSDFSNSGFAYCQKCKEGYYNIEGICHPCNEGSQGCAECTYKNEENDTNKIFKCKKCLNDEEYKLNDEFRCVKCNEYLKNCQKCHFIGDNFEVKCDDCLNGYYSEEYKTCCNRERITVIAINVLQTRHQNIVGVFQVTH